MTETRGRATQGRYSNINSAQHPGPELPAQANYPRAKIRIGAVIDPMPDPDGKRPTRQRVAINANSDALEHEHAYGRLSDQAYRAGRTYQQILEVSRGATSGGISFEPKDRANPATAHEWAIISGLERAQWAVDLTHTVREVVGQNAEALLSDVLVALITLQQAAQARGYSSKHGTRKIAGEFREALEDLGGHWDKIGWPPIEY
jgi:hypothetical protein